MSDNEEKYVPYDHEEWKSTMKLKYVDNWALREILEWDLDTKTKWLSKRIENPWKSSPYKDLKKKRRSNFCFVTVNFDEKKVNNPTDAHDIIKTLLKTKFITNYAYSFEWRNHEQETGLHCHLILLGQVKYITRHLSTRKGPYTQLNKKFNTVKLYPMDYIKDKLDYIQGNTWDESKSSKKELDTLLRVKYNLPIINNLNII